MKLYHGTKENDGNKIAGPPQSVDVNLGGGEMGKGFYVGDNLTLAIAWAKGRNKKPAVLEFEIDNKKYAQMAFKQLSHSAVLSTWHQLRRSKQHRVHTFGYDIVFGPLATAPYACQYKFESSSSENLLNNSIIDRII